MGSRKRKRANASSLANDILFNNILISLPAKQLAQMRSVCKTWNAVLTQPWFIKCHLNHSIHKNNNNKDESTLLIFKNRFSLEEGCKPFTIHHTRSPHIETTNLIKLPTHTSSSVHGGSGNYIIIGSVNGLICFSNDYRSSKDQVVIYIWNPSLSALLTIPVPPYTNYINIDNDRFSSNKYYPLILLRFGFDPKNDDYKVVKLKFSPGGLLVKSVWLQAVEVYSMNEGCWKSITERPPPNVSIVNNDNQLCVDEQASTFGGHLHWIGYLDDDIYQVQAIVTFDLGLEVFGEIRLPDSITPVNYANVMGLLDGKLCVMSRMVTGDDRSYQVWVMNEYGVADSWVKNHVFSQVFSGSLRAFGFTLNNELILQPENQPLALYDPLEAKLKSFNKVYRFYSQDFRTKLVSYVDSLVWVRTVAPAMYPN